MTISSRVLPTVKFQSVRKPAHLREKLLKYGPEKLSQIELLTILLGTGARGKSAVEVARKICRQFPGEALVQARPEELMGTFGLGSAKACEIIVCFELGKRLLKGKKTHLYLSPKDVWESLRDIRGNKREHFVIFYLDIHQQEIMRETVSIGTLSANLVHPREVFEAAVRHSAAQLIIAHNHPSGSVEPSPEDLEVTRRLAEAGNILGIEVLDHVIVTTDAFVSFKERGFM
jgi:DNA repair protein RadC